MASGADLLATAGIDTTTLEAGLSKIEGKLDTVSSATRRADTSLNNFSKTSKKADSNLRSLGQASLQIQDVAVQAQAGADAVRILAQQGSQLASIFGPGGAIVGGGIAIAASFWSTTAAAKELDERLKNIQKRYDAIVSAEDQISKAYELANIADMERLFSKDIAEQTKLRFEYEDKISKIKKNQDLDIATRKNLIDAETERYEAELKLLQHRAEIQDEEKQLSEAERKKTEEARKQEQIKEGIIRRDREWDDEYYSRLKKRIDEEKRKREELQEGIHRRDREWSEEENRRLRDRIKIQEDADEKAKRAKEESERKAEEAFQRRVDRELMSPSERRKADKEARERERKERKIRTRDRIREENARRGAHGQRGADVPASARGAASKGGLTTGTLTTGTINGATLIIKELKHA